MIAAVGFGICGCSTHHFSPHKLDQDKQYQQTTTLNGRVLGSVPAILLPTGHDGPDVQFVVFLPDVATKGNNPPTPIEVDYQYFPNEPMLPESFFDYTKHYKLRVTSDSRCDTTAGELFYLRLMDRSGKTLERLFRFQPAQGAPKIDLNDDIAIPCYILGPGQYDILEQ